MTVVALCATKAFITIKFVNCHHKQLLREYQLDVVVMFGQEAAQLYSGENVFSVTWLAPSVHQVETDLFSRALYGALSGTTAMLRQALEDEVMV